MSGGSTPLTKQAAITAQDARLQSILMLAQNGLIHKGMSAEQKDYALRVMDYNYNKAGQAVMAGVKPKDIWGGITINIPGSDVSQAGQDAASGATDLEKMRREMAQSYGFTMQSSQRMMPAYETTQQSLASGSLLGLGGAVGG